jgi:hypothetical protein
VTRLARRDAEVCAHLEKALALPPEAVRRIPLFSEDVHALESLRRMASYLFGNAADA